MDRVVRNEQGRIIGLVDEEGETIAEVVREDGKLVGVEVVRPAATPEEVEAVRQELHEEVVGARSDVFERIDEVRRVQAGHVAHVAERVEALEAPELPTWPEFHALLGSLKKRVKRDGGPLHRLLVEAIDAADGGHLAIAVGLLRQADRQVP